MMLASYWQIFFQYTPLFLLLVCILGIEQQEFWTIKKVVEAEVVSECGYEALQVVLEYQEYVEAELENVVEVG